MVAPRGVVRAALVLAALLAGQHALGASSGTTVSVIMGQPSEFSFTLSKSSMLPRTVTFSVSNSGVLAHQFFVCATASAKATRTTCKGKGTKFLDAGESAKLTITFAKNGTYEFLSGYPGQAAKGMKGLIGIGVSAPSASGNPDSSAGNVVAGGSLAGATPTTTPSPGTDPNSGASLFVSLQCVSCHSLVAVQASGIVTPSINETHPTPFLNGPLTPTQITALTAYINR